MFACHRGASFVLRLIAGAALLVTFSALAHAGVDQTTGVVSTAQGGVPGPLPPPVDGGTEVLWDLTHGVYLDYEPGGVFSNFVGILSGLGYNFSTTNAGIDNIDLSAYDILVICVGSCYDTPYTPSEAAAALAFAQAGGSVLIMGDNPNAWPDHLNPLSQVFGITTGTFYILPDDLFFSSFTAHPIFIGIDQIYYRASGALQVAAPATDIARTDDGAHITIADVRALCTIALGDINPWDNAYIGNADNQAFGINVFNYLRECAGATSVEPTTWGRVKSLY
jgi:hypothetical protein